MALLMLFINNLCCRSLDKIQSIGVFVVVVVVVVVVGVVLVALFLIQRTNRAIKKCMYSLCLLDKLNKNGKRIVRESTKVF